MPKLTAKVRGLFAARWKQRIEAWSSVKKLSAAVKTPDELRWVYWQEYGTAATGESGHASGHSYPIDPVNAKALVFPGPGGKTVTLHVDHPGIPARHSVRDVLPDIRRQTREALREVLSDSGADYPDRVRASLLASAEAAKGAVTDSLEENLKGVRPGGDGIPAGRLEGESAASVFDALSTVVDTSD